MKKCLLLLLLAFPMFSASAQVPGYMGKKFGVGYQLNFFPLFTQLSLNNLANQGIQRHGFYFMHKHEFTAYATLSRRIMLGASYYLLRETYTFPQSTYSIPGSYRPATAPVVKGPVRGNLLGLYLRVYRRNFIAPIGVYHQFGLSYVQLGMGDINAFPEDHRIRTEAEAGRYNPKQVGIEAWRISYGMGITYAPTKSMFLNMGGTLNFNVGKRPIHPQIPSGNSIADRVYESIQGYFKVGHRVEIKLGIGYMF